MVVIMEWAPNRELPPFLRWSTEPEALDDLQEWHGPGRLHDLSKALMPGLSPPELVFADRMVTRDSRATGTAATWDRFVDIEYARLREVVEVPPAGTWFNVGDS